GLVGRRQGVRRRAHPLEARPLRLLAREVRRLRPRPDRCAVVVPLRRGLGGRLPGRARRPARRGRRGASGGGVAPSPRPGAARAPVRFAAMIGTEPAHTRHTRVRVSSLRSWQGGNSRGTPGGTTGRRGGTRPRGAWV